LAGLVGFEQREAGDEVNGAGRGIGFEELGEGEIGVGVFFAGVEGEGEVELEAGFLGDLFDEGAVEAFGVGEAAFAHGAGGGGGGVVLGREEGGEKEQEERLHGFN
jgi:hypothetical protein